MDLQEFVKETLTQVVQGVKDSNEAIAGLGGSVAPPRDNPFENIEFDVAVTVDSGTEGGILEAGKESGGILKVAAHVIEASVKGVSQTSEQTVSRVRFRVPVLLPPGDTGNYFKAKRAVNEAERVVVTGQA